MEKRQCEKTFMFFAVFPLDHDSFPRIMALLISNIFLQNCYSKSFTMNSYFPLKMWSFFPRMFSCVRYILLGLSEESLTFLTMMMIFQQRFYCWQQKCVGCLKKQLFIFWREWCYNKIHSWRCAIFWWFVQQHQGKSKA